MRSINLVMAVAHASAACGDSDGVTGPTGRADGSMTVDASSGWAYVSLGDEASEVEVADPSTSTAWTLAFDVTSVMLNGGVAGPGGVEGYCVCRNAGASDAEVMAMTPSSVQAAFDAVTLADVPGEGEWQSEAVVPAIDDWYAYDMSSHTVTANPAAVYAVRTASGDAYAKLHVVAIEGATQQTAGTVTIEYALQPAAGAAFGATDTLVVDVSGGEQRIDLETGAVVAGADWDLAIEGWDIRVNGGVSGEGSAGAYATETAFDALTDVSQAPASAYRADELGGVFAEHPWYRYNLQGDHQIWPTYDVYLLRRGDDVWKVQLTGYYGAGGDPRQITFRYERLR